MLNIFKQLRAWWIAKTAIPSEWLATSNTNKNHAEKENQQNNPTAIDITTTISEADIKQSKRFKLHTVDWNDPAYHAWIEGGA